MPTVTELLRRRLLAGVPERLPDLATLQQSERSPEFERLRMNRKILGAMRYGRMGAEGKPQFDRVSDAIGRLERYLSDRNAEHLADAANLLEVEFVEGDWHLTPSDDGQHTRQR
jgi:hypothetical protein